MIQGIRYCCTPGCGAHYASRITRIARGGGPQPAERRNPTTPAVERERCCLPSSDCRSNTQSVPRFYDSDDNSCAEMGVRPRGRAHAVIAADLCRATRGDTRGHPGRGTRGRRSSDAGPPGMGAGPFQTGGAATTGHRCSRMIGVSPSWLLTVNLYQLAGSELLRKNTPHRRSAQGQRFPAGLAPAAGAAASVERYPAPLPGVDRAEWPLQS
jgi:hypothetical protein